MTKTSEFKSTFRAGIQLKIRYLNSISNWGNFLNAIIRNTALSFILLTRVCMCILIVSSAPCTRVLLRRRAVFKVASRIFSYLFYLYHCISKIFIHNLKLSLQLNSVESFILCLCVCIFVCMLRTKFWINQRLLLLEFSVSLKTQHGFRPHFFSWQCNGTLNFDCERLVVKR